MKYLKFMPFNSVQNASRNRRELSVAKEYGFDVYCYSSDKKGSINELELPFSMIYDETPSLLVSPEIPHVIRVVRVFNNMLQHARRLRNLHMDVISCHNIKALATAWIACIGIFGKKRPRLIYDSHEFELGRQKRSNNKYQLLKFAEGFFIRKCVFTIVVNEGIGEELVRIHKLKSKPVSVRSTPEYWHLDDTVTHSMRKEFTQKLNIPEDSFIISYTGYFLPYRGLEDLIEALRIENDVYSVWVGRAESIEYGKKIDGLIENAGIQNRVLRYPLQPQRDLWKFVSAVSAASVVMNGKDNLNYKFALPNKFFEAIQSMTPVICSNTGEMSRIVNEYNIGLLVPSGDGQALAEAIQKMKSNRELYLQFKENLKKAKDDLCWEKEKSILFHAYETYLR